MTPQKPGGFFDDNGTPIPKAWDEIDVPGVTDQEAYALEITGDSMLPVYREGDLIIVSPNTSLRKGDRVVVKTRSGEVFARVLISQGTKVVRLAHFDPNKPEEKRDLADNDWIARIIWTPRITLPKSAMM